jgi:hypothetical protein
MGGTRAAWQPGARAHLLLAALRRVRDRGDVAPAGRAGRPGGDQRARAAAAAPVVRVAQEQRRAHQRRRLRQQRLRRAAARLSAVARAHSDLRRSLPTRVAYCHGMPLSPRGRGRALCTISSQPRST